MHVVENAVIVGHSSGESDIYVFSNTQTGRQRTVHNPSGLVLELGQEGTLTYKESPISQLISFEPVQ